MKEKELETAERLASIFRCARKASGLTQLEVAERLQISRNSYSQIEKATYLPPAVYWFEFCELTKISPNSAQTGYIESLRPATLKEGAFENAFRIPDRYLAHRGSKVRSLLPFLDYFKSVLGLKGLRDYFKSLKMDPDLFVDLDLQVNLNVCTDLAKTLIQKGFLTPENVPNLTRPVTEPRIHGSIHRAYDNRKSLGDLISALILNSRHYECNFLYRIEEAKTDEVALSIRPEKHLKDLPSWRDPGLGDFLCRYKKHYFQRFAHYDDLGGAILEEKECLYKGDDQCLYQLKAVS